MAVQIGLLGREARPLRPLVLRALDDPDTEVRDFAATTLKKIDPETAAKAGAK